MTKIIKKMFGDPLWVQNFWLNLLSTLLCENGFSNIIIIIPCSTSTWTKKVIYLWKNLLFPFTNSVWFSSGCWCAPLVDNNCWPIPPLRWRYCVDWFLKRSWLRLRPMFTRCSSLLLRAWRSRAAVASRKHWDTKSSPTKMNALIVNVASLYATDTRIL